MFGWLKTDPAQKLKRAYATTLEEARDAQRNGNLLLCSDLTNEAEEILKQLDEVEARQSATNATA